MLVMRIDPAGWPFIGTAAAVALASFAFGLPVPGALSGVLSAFFLFFFRDPARTPPGNDSAAVLSPADGRVMVAGEAQPGTAPPGIWRQVSIFLSPMDVHVNRVPVSGVVVKVEHRAGRFLPAYRHDAASENERSEVWVEHDGQTVVFRQVVGILARRVVCRLRPGQRVEAGDRFGIMKFGSRMDIFLPATALIRVAVGDMVRGGETVVAIL
jgi:phosphatidylserine decarboxylase